MAIFSLEVEKNCLSSLLKFPDILSEISAFVKENDFFQETHRIIFSIIRARYFDNKKIDKVLVAQEFKNLGIIPKENLEIGDYLEALSYSQVTYPAGIESFKELCHLRICRDLDLMGNNVSEFVNSNKSKTTSELVHGVDSICNKTIDLWTPESEPQDIFADLEQSLLEKAKNPEEEIGLISPFKEFNTLYGGIRSKNGVYAVVSRPKHGKSSFLSYMAKGCVLMNNSCKALILDTEMTKEISQYRAASSLTNIPMWWLESGQWVKNKEFTHKFNESKHAISQLKNKVYHLKVANKPIDEICSIIKRWYFKEVGRGGKAIIIYDYIKLTGEKISNNYGEYQIIGDKINMLNEVGGQIDAPIWVAMQLNRSAEDGRDDSSAISISDRLQWFAAFVAIFRRKRPDEITEDGIEFGSHKLIPLATRFQGKNAPGHHDLVKIPTGKDKYKMAINYLNFNVENFRIEERGSLRDVIRVNSCKAKEQPKATNNEDVEI